MPQTSLDSDFESSLQYDKDIKGQIISSFTSESPLRIVCATVAFGMGLDCTDVCQVAP